MSRTTRIRVLNLALHGVLTHGHGSMQGSGRSLAVQGSMTTHAGAMTAASAMGGTPAMSAADRQAIQQRALIAETTRAALADQGWTVTVVDGDGADSYTGIEATRGTEHLVAAVGADDLIADQAGAHNCVATVQAITEGLRAIGATATVTDDVPHDGNGGSLYAVPGGPTKAHAIARTLRRAPGAPGRHREGPTPLQASSGDQ
jgi:hypothetical protein